MKIKQNSNFGVGRDLNNPSLAEMVVEPNNDALKVEIENLKYNLIETLKDINYMQKRIDFLELSIKAITGVLVKAGGENE